MHELYAPTKGLRDIELRGQRAKTMETTSVYHSLIRGMPFSARHVPQVKVPPEEWQTLPAKQNWTDICNPSSSRISKQAKADFKKVIGGGKKTF